jgi:hypothetical protein
MSWVYDAISVICEKRTLMAPALRLRDLERTRSFTRAPWRYDIHEGQSLRSANATTESAIAQQHALDAAVDLIHYLGAMLRGA